jgi:hypothetical protein
MINMCDTMYRERPHDHQDPTWMAISEHHDIGSSSRTTCRNFLSIKNHPHYTSSYFRHDVAVSSCVCFVRLFHCKFLMCCRWSRSIRSDHLASSQELEDTLPTYGSEHTTPLGSHCCQTIREQRYSCVSRPTAVAHMHIIFHTLL